MAPKNIYINPNLKPKRIPARRVSFTSPHPNDSCLKALSPSILTESIIKNNNNPLKICLKANRRPPDKNVIIRERTAPIITTSSKITIYLQSDIIVIITTDTKTIDKRVS